MAGGGLLRWLKRGERSGVEHVTRRQPAAARLPDAVLEMGKIERVMRVGIDAHQHAFITGHLV